MPKGVYKNPKERAEKISKAHKGQHHSIKTEFKEGHSYYAPKNIKKWKENLSKAHTGKKLTTEHKKKLSTAHIGISRSPFTEKHKRNISKSHSGKNHYRWIKDRSVLERNKRNDPEYKQWVRKVKKRDNNICQLKDKNCSGYNIVHHIKNWSEYLELRYKIKNGITLCQFHHPRTRKDEKRLMPIFEKLVGSNE